MKSIEQIALLYEQTIDGNEHAASELTRLIADDLDARMTYLNVVWLESCLPFSPTLIKRQLDDNKTSVSAVIEEKVSTGHAIVCADQVFDRSAISVESIPSAISGRGFRSVVPAVAAIAAGLLIVASVAYLFSDKNDQVIVANNLEDVPRVKQVEPTDQNNLSEDSGETRSELPVTSNVAFNNLAHPPKGGKLPGGIVIDEAPVPDTISFNFHVRPILSENCFYCHGPDGNHREADLRLDTEDGFLEAIEPGEPDDSELIARIFSDDADMLMPPPESGRSLSQRQRLILKRWINQGANYENHWAYDAPVKMPVPDVQRENWPRNVIDQFVLAKLERRNIKPSPRAEASILVRRLYLDLIGLPPTPEQSKSFIADYESEPDGTVDGLVDQLLDSPHYGERMALPWLDAARYSDSNGFQEDGDRTQWPWRDWVIDAFNKNMPFDQFTIEQLAGDLLPDPSQDQLIATGFNRNHMLNGEGGAIKEEQRTNYVFDRVDTTASTWMGLTMACAQCHDHKYDPITQEDYYRFFAYFNNIDEQGGVDRKLGRKQCAKPFLEMPTDEQTKELKTLDAEIAPLKKSLSDADEEITKAMRKWEEVARSKATPKNMNRDLFNILVKKPSERGKSADEKLKAWFIEHAAKKEWREIKKKQLSLERKRRKTKERILTVMVMRELKKPRETHIMDRGNYEAPLEQVTSNVPHFLPQLDNSENSTRLDLARWLVSNENPLTARVQVNRYWQTFFGTGLVKTPEDFGVQGELPSHPELLDWLAVDFRESGWDIKRMQRMMVTSETYLQSSKTRSDLNDTDPENRLLARGSRHRMSSLLIRDAALAVSGLLNPEIGGEPVYPYQPDGLWKEFSLERFGYQTSKGNDLHRRSIYTFWRRTVAPPNMFDAPSRQICTVKLSRTNTPLHALTLLNDPTYVEAACFLANEILFDRDKSAKRNREEVLGRAFSQSVGRDPNQSEIASLSMALDDSRQYFFDHVNDAKEYVSVGSTVSLPDSEEQIVELAAVTSVLQVIMNTDEFMTRE